jgi:hypothetical protein
MVDPPESYEALRGDAALISDSPREVSQGRQPASVPEVSARDPIYQPPLGIDQAMTPSGVTGMVDMGSAKRFPVEHEQQGISSSSLHKLHTHVSSTMQR